jgi:hypothetical protein
VLVLRRGMSARYRFDNVAQMLEAFERQRFRLGVIAGFTYASDKVNTYIADPAHDATIVKVGDDTENLRNLLAGVIDGFIADRIVAATVAWRQQKSGEIEEYPLYMTTPIHFMRSRASQSPAMLDRLNSAIDEIRRSASASPIPTRCPSSFTRPSTPAGSRRWRSSAPSPSPCRASCWRMPADTPCSARWCSRASRRSAAACCAT